MKNKLLYLFSSMECYICYELINNDKFILECNHTFHKECIKKWFKKNNYKLCKDLCKCNERYSSCPICRAKVKVSYLNPKYIQLYEKFILRKFVCII